MKPKNRVMCPDCGRQKMLFGTEKEAQTFLKFNGQELNPDGTRELRVYWCPACCGYHISSHNYKGDNKRTDRLIEAYNRDVADHDPVLVGETVDYMMKLGLETRNEVNKFLREKSGYSQWCKDRIRQIYYKAKGI